MHLSPTFIVLVLCIHIAQGSYQLVMPCYVKCCFTYRFECQLGALRFNLSQFEAARLVLPNPPPLLWEYLTPPLPISHKRVACILAEHQHLFYRILNSVVWIGNV